jgi:histidinol-phosphate aminotransferase
MSLDRIAQWLRPAVANMTAYAVADASGMVKLDAMENPYELPVELRTEWAEQLKQIAVNRYPDPGARKLKLIMREQLSLPAESGMILGNGSDEIIQMLALALGGEGRLFMSLEPAFVMYRLIALMNGLQYTSVDLRKKDFSIDMAATLELIQQQQPAVVFVANPNNPTGNIHNLDELRQIAQAVPGLMVVDEAYEPFTDVTALPLMEEFDHVMVMRTVSKMGLAGLRLGYLLGSQAWIEQLEKVRLPYNINILSQHAAIFALEHIQTFKDQASRIRSDRQKMFTILETMSSIQVWPSESNFILLRVPEGQGSNVYEQLKQRGILVKLLDGAHPHLRDCLRITVGSVAENERFLEDLRELLA